MTDTEIQLKQLFANFVAQEKIKENTSEEYLTFLKILWGGFSNIITKNKNQRKIYILELLEKYLTDKDFQEKINALALPEQSEVTLSRSEATPEITLKKIILNNFRGFRVNENNKGRILDFNKKTTLIFAPNGGGKTSVCEALEWTLTGDSSERRERKSEPKENYFQNNYKDTPSYNTTKLHLTEESVTIPNLIYDRCFLEKNRIEKFAKLAIQPSTEIQKVLGELFEFSNIVNFFKEFGQDISPTDKEKNQPGREKWIIWLDWNSRKTQQEKIVEESKINENKAISDLYRLIGDKNFNNKKIEIENAGKKLSEEIDAAEKNYSSEFSAKDFEQKIKNYLSKIEDWKKINKRITDNAKKLDFEKLFQAAKIVFQSYKDAKCPLCDTPFEQSGSIFKREGVTADPRRKTEKELKKLKNFSGWKQEISKIETNFKGLDFRLIRDQWQKIKLNLTEDNWQGLAGKKEKPSLPELDFDKLESKLGLNTKDFIEECEKALSVDFAPIYALEKTISDYIARRKNDLKSKHKKEAKVNELRTEYIKLQEQINTLSAKRQVRESNEKSLQKIIHEEDNAKKFIKILESYHIFFENVQFFQSNLILAEGAGIDDYVTGFYRALNLYDHEEEKVKEIKFPKNIQDEFCLKYVKDEDTTCNALNLLSEGHLRTLGLAALLARAVKYKIPVLIFDDAINAIDSDHRDNIAFLITNNFSDDNGADCFGDSWSKIKNYFKNCQFVITTHDRFFDEKVANLFIKDSQKRYVLYSGKNGIDFCDKGNPGNFEAKIENFLNEEIQDIRSAIFYCRIWLEELLLSKSSEFNRPSNNKPINFENVIEKKTRQLKNPELVTIINKLIKYLGEEENEDDDKEMAEILNDIIQEKDGKYVWLFDILNQESHYRRFNHVDISNAPTSQEVRNVFQKIQEIHSIIQQT